MPIDTPTLRQFSPLNTLDEQLLAMMSKDTDVKHAEAAQCLFHANDANTEAYFLLSGSVRLTSAEGQDSVIEAGLPNSNRPLSPYQPRQHTAVATTAIDYFTVNASVFAELVRGADKSVDYLSMQASTSTPGRDGTTLLHQFEHELNRGSFVLPSFPDVALKIRKLIEDPDSSITELVPLVQSDPALAAKLIQTANCPLYRGVSSCNDISAAVTRLGLMTTKQLVTSFAILSLFTPGSTMLKHHLQQLRKESVAVATYSYVVAKQIPSLSAEEALLAGLLHTLGALVVFSYADRFPELDNDELQLAVILNKLAGPVGVMVLESWEFSDNLIAVARHASDWLHASEAGEDHDNKMDYCELVLAARALVLMRGESVGSSPSSSCIPAYNKLLQQITSEQIDTIIHDAEEQLQQLQGLLRD